LPDENNEHKEGHWTIPNLYHNSCQTDFLGFLNEEDIQLSKNNLLTCSFITMASKTGHLWQLIFLTIAFISCLIMN
jgi:hypothetical protein